MFFKKPLVLGLLSLSGWVMADPITITNAGYWLESVGPNTVGVAGGGEPGGRLRTFFISNDTNPSGGAGTTATATFGDGSVAPSPFFQNNEWARGFASTSGLLPAALKGYNVQFANGSDSANFMGQNLENVTPLPLALNLTVDGSVNPLSPLISWQLPSGPGVDTDRIQLLFFNDDTDARVGGQPTLSGSTTSFQITSVLPAGFNLVTNVFLFDLIDDSQPFVRENILRGSRAYVTYSSPVPEPSTMLLIVAGLGAMVGWRRRSC